MLDHQLYLYDEQFNCLVVFDSPKSFFKKDGFIHVETTSSKHSLSEKFYKILSSEQYLEQILRGSKSFRG